MRLIGQPCIPDFDTLQNEVTAWETSRNTAEAKVHWQFTTTDARIKLKRLYPVIDPINTKLPDH